MMKRILPSRPAGQSFKRTTATIIRINPDEFVPDYGHSAIDLAIVELQTAMFGHQEQSLEMVRDYLDCLGTARFHLIGLTRRRKTEGTFSDFALAAAMLHQDSPFGIAYKWPTGTTLVMYRGHVYKRDGDTLTLVGDE